MAFHDKNDKNLTAIADAAFGLLHQAVPDSRLARPLPCT